MNPVNMMMKEQSQTSAPKTAPTAPQQQSTQPEQPSFFVTNEMTAEVMNAIYVLSKSKGGMNKMHSTEAIEEIIFSSGKHAPVTLTIRALIDQKLVRYFKLDSGKLVYGFTKQAIASLEKEVK